MIRKYQNPLRRNTLPLPVVINFQITIQTLSFYSSRCQIPVHHVISIKNIVFLLSHSKASFYHTIFPFLTYRTYPTTSPPQVIKEDPLIANHPSTWTPSNHPIPSLFFTGASIRNERHDNSPDFSLLLTSPVNRVSSDQADMTRQLPEESIDLERYVASDQLSGAGMVRPEPRFRDRVVILNKGGIYYEPVVLYRTFARVIRKIWFLFLRLIFFFPL